MAVAHPRYYGPETYERARTLYQRGLTIGAISQRLDIGRTTANRWVSRFRSEQTDPLMIPLERLWFRAEAVKEYLDRMIGGPEEVFDRLGPKQHRRTARTYNDILEGRKRWVRFDVVDAMFCRCGLIISMWDEQPVATDSVFPPTEERA